MLNACSVRATLDIGLIVILDAALRCLGLGVKPPDPSGGTMIAAGRGYLDRAWLICILPGCALMATVLCGNLLGDALRDRFASTHFGESVPPAGSLPAPMRSPHVLRS